MTDNESSDSDYIINRFSAYKNIKNIRNFLNKNNTDSESNVESENESDEESDSKNIRNILNKNNTDTETNSDSESESIKVFIKSKNNIFNKLDSENELENNEDEENTNDDGEAIENIKQLIKKSIISSDEDEEEEKFIPNKFKKKSNYKTSDESNFTTENESTDLDDIRKERKKHRQEMLELQIEKALQKIIEKKISQSIHQLKFEEKEEVPKKFKCERCNSVFKAAGFLRRHSEICNDNRYICVTCNKHFNNKKQQNKHKCPLDPKHPEYRINCLICNKQCTSINMRIKHEEICKNILQQKTAQNKDNIIEFKCSFCLKYFNTEKSLNCHKARCVINLKQKELEEKEKDLIKKQKQLKESNNLVQLLLNK